MLYTICIRHFDRLHDIYSTCMFYSICRFLYIGLVYKQHCVVNYALTAELVTAKPGKLINRWGSCAGR